MIPNFHQVEGNLYRSGRPTDTDIALVKSQFGAVVSLEGLDEDIKEQAALQPSVRVLSFPIVFLQIYVIGIRQSYLKDILDAIDRELAKGSMLVHCQHGQDRTGLIVAAWRVRHGWTHEQAQTEMRAMGYRWWINL